MTNEGALGQQQTFPILALQVSILALQVQTDSSLFREILPKVGVEVAARAATATEMAFDTTWSLRQGARPESSINLPQEMWC